MDNPDYVRLKRTNYGCLGIFVAVFLSFFGWLVSDDSSVGALIVIAVGLFGGAIIGAIRTDIFFDRAHRKIIRSRSGIFGGDSEFDLDQCSIRVKSANDSGIFHAISINASVDGRDKNVTSQREDIDGFQRTRKQAQDWAALMGIPILDETFGEPRQRNPDELTVPLVLRESTKTISAPPPNSAVHVSHVDGMMVFKLGDRQKLYVGAQAMKLVADIYISTLSHTIAMNEVMELDFERPSNNLVMLTKNALILLGSGLSEDDQEWLRHAILFAMVEMRRT